MPKNIKKDSKDVHIALLMMLKNEKKRLHVSLESVKDTVDSMIIFDTGSTDNTIEILQEFSSKHNIPLRLKQGEFVNFCESRNECLDFADTFEDVDYLLLLDCNDELQGGNELREYAKDMLNSDLSCFLLRQEWWSGSSNTYYNTRFIKPRKGWRYKGRVHEYMCNMNEDKEGINTKKERINKKGVCLYQDRTQDDNKTSKRFERDYELLMQDHLDEPEEPRTLFYLAQTCGCLGRKDESLYYYKQRSLFDGFWEEKFHAYLRCGELCKDLEYNWEEQLGWYMKAFNHSKRVEPLLKIAEYYVDKDDFETAYMFAKKAYKLDYPHHCILFIDKISYQYYRYHMLGRIAYYVGKYKIGREACLKAIEYKNADVDKGNLKFYDDKLEELKPPTKEEYISKRIKEFRKDDKTSSNTQLRFKAVKEYLEKYKNKK